MKNKIDFELIAATAEEINGRVKTIVNLIPINEDTNKMAKHLASFSIHLSMFMRDVLKYMHGSKTGLKDYEKKFLDMCGCNYNEK